MNISLDCYFTVKEKCLFSLYITGLQNINYSKWYSISGWKKTFSCKASIFRPFFDHLKLTFQEIFPNFIFLEKIAFKNHSFFHLFWLYNHMAAPLATNMLVNRRQVKKSATLLELCRVPKGAVASQMRTTGLDCFLMGNWCKNTKMKKKCKILSITIFDHIC